MAARVIGEASIRLRADSKGLSADIRKTIQAALVKASAGLDVQPTKAVEKDAERSSERVRALFSDAFKSIGSSAASVGGSLGSGLLSGGRLLALGAAAGTAVSAVGGLSAGLVAVVGAAAQAGGAIGILPAALVGLKAVSATVKLGLTGVQDSLSSLSEGDFEQFNKDIQKLQPSARATVLALAEFRPAFTDLRGSVQQALFSDLEGQVRRLGERYLPVASGLFVGLAKDINSTAREVGDFLNTEGAFKQVNRATVDIASGFGEVRKAAVPLTSVFVDIVQGGATQLPRVGTAISGVAERLRGFISEAASSGRLEAFFSNALDVASQLGRTVANLGAGIGQLFGAGMNAGRGLLDNLERLSSEFREFTESAEGQQAFSSFFQSIGSLSEVAIPIVKALAVAIGSGLAPLIGDLAQGVGPGFLAVVNQLLPTIQALSPGVALLGGALGSLLSTLAPLLPTIGTLIGQLATGLAQAVVAVLPYITSLVSYFAESPGALLALVGGVGAVFAALGPLSGVITSVSSLVSGLIANAGGLRVALTALTGPVGLAIAAFIALFAGSEQFRTAVLGLLGTIGSLVGSLLASLQPVLGVLLDIFNRLVAQIGSALAPVITLVTNLLTSVLTPAINSLNPIVAAVIPVLQQVGDVFSILISAVTPFIDILVNLLQPVVQNVGQIVGATFEFIAGVVTAAMRIVQGIIDVVLGVITGDFDRAWSGVQNIVRGAVDGIKAFVSGGFNLIGSIISGVWNTVLSVTKMAVGGLIDAVSNGISNTLQFFRDLPGNIGRALGALENLLLEAGKDLIRGFLNGVKALAGSIADSVLGPIKDTVNKVKGFLGINSPSRLFRDIGMNTGQGFVQGIAAITPAVVAAGVDMAAALANSMDAVSGLSTNITAAGGGVGGVAPGGVTINQTNLMQPGADVVQFADTVAAELNWDLTAGGTLRPVGSSSPQRGFTGIGV